MRKGLAGKHHSELRAGEIGYNCKSGCIFFYRFSQAAPAFLIFRRGYARIL